MIGLLRRPPVAADRPIERQADVCLIVEGCYPYVPGGVSSWVDWLMRNQPERSFSVVSIVTGHEPRIVRYDQPQNLIDHRDLVLHESRQRPLVARRRSGPDRTQAVAAALTRFVKGGGLVEFQELVGIVNRPGNELSLYDLLDSQGAMAMVRAMYEALMPHASFLQFYWAWRALFGGLFATLKFQLPRARSLSCDLDRLCGTAGGARRGRDRPPDA